MEIDKRRKKKNLTFYKDFRTEKHIKLPYLPAMLSKLKKHFFL